MYLNLAARILILATLPILAAAGQYVSFENCLDIEAARNSGEPYFVPTDVSAYYAPADSRGKHTLRLSVRGDVTNGDIIAVNTTSNMFTTLRAQLYVLQYRLYDQYNEFCQYTVGGCPAGGEGITFEYAFNVSNAYQGVSLGTTFYILSPSSRSGDVMGCVVASTTPVMESYVWYVLVFGILAIAVFWAAAYLLASWFNPWTGTYDVLLSSTNYGHQLEALRLVTPGVIDFVTFLQYVFFLASLTLEFPGFFQPVVSSVSWAVLQFHTTFSSHIVENFPANLYVAPTNGTDGQYGLSTMAREVQLATDQDVWAGFVSWLFIFTGILLAICAPALFVSWRVRRNRVEGFSKGHVWRFLVGMLVRIFLRLFALPLMAFNFFQLVIAGSSPAVQPAFAAIFLVGWVAAAVYVAWAVRRVRPAENLWEDLHLCLVYGPLYNTYAVSAANANFVAVELGATFLRALAIGAIQRSGLAQITLLACIEMGYLMALVFARPYDRETNMNATSVVLSFVRFVLVFLMIPFVPQMNVRASTRGWIAYVILLICGVVFILAVARVIQVLFELAIRRAGAGSAATSGTDYKDNGPYNPAYPGAYTSADVGLGIGTRSGHMSDDDGPGLSAVSEKDALRGIDSGSVSPGGASLLPRSNTITSYRGSNTSAGPQRDSYYEANGLHLAPTTPTSTDIASPTTAVAPQNSNNFYRRPRRRQSSVDWAVVEERDGLNTASGSIRGSVVGEEVTAATTDDLTRKDYSRREADLYYRGASAGGAMLSDDLSAADDPRQSSLNPLVSSDNSAYPPSSPVAADTTAFGTSTNNNNRNSRSGEERIRTLLNMTIGRLMPHRKSQEPDPQPGKGFEVLNRRRIQPTYTRVPGGTTTGTGTGTGTASTTAADSITDTTVSEPAATATKLKPREFSRQQAGSPEEEPFIFIPEPMGRPSKVADRGLRIDTAATTTGQALSHPPSGVSASETGTSYSTAPGSSD